MQENNFILTDASYFWVDSVKNSVGKIEIQHPALW